MPSDAAALEFPAPLAPDPGTLVEVAPGVLWLRLALPFALDHVNIYLLEDGPGWAVLDTGINDALSRAVWESLLDGPLAGRRPTRLIVTHFHPDHVGLAGWLAEKCDIELIMSRTEYLTTQFHRRRVEEDEITAWRSFFFRCGLDEKASHAILERDFSYRQRTSALPAKFRRIAAGDVLTIGGRQFEVLTGAGHSPELVMLVCREERLFLAADQVLARISPNVSVWPQEPESDPLGDFLNTAAELERAVPDDVLVLAAHNLPFRNLHARLRELAGHHRERCDAVIAACEAAPLMPAEILRKLFLRPLDAHQTGFAFGETLAHINYLLRRGRMIPELSADGRLRVRPA